MPVTPIDIPALAERLLALLQGTEDGVSIDWLMRGLKQSRFSVEKALYLLQGAGFVERHRRLKGFALTDAGRAARPDTLRLQLAGALPAMPTPPVTAATPPRSPESEQTRTPEPGGDARPAPQQARRFDAADLYRSVITQPLREAMQLVTAGKHTDAASLYVVDAAGRLSVIIALSSTYPGGRAHARERVCDLLVRVTFDANLPGTLTRTLRSERRDSSDHYVFAWLTPSHIEALVTADQADADGEPRPAITRLWPDNQLQAFNSRSLPTIKADAARNAFGCTGRGIVWAVVDSGIDGTHPHFRLHANLTDLPTGVVHRDLTGATTEAPLEDGYGHGTHVAGIVAGQWEADADAPAAVTVFERDVQDNAVTREEPVRRVSGVAPECKLVSYKVLDSAGRGGVTNVMTALEDILRVNAFGRQPIIHGVNLSLGYPFNPRWFACGHSPLCEVVNRLARAGVFVVAAAGNSGYGYVDTAMAGTWAQGLPMSITDPGNADRAITVGSTHRDAPHTYGVSYFSSKGPTGDGRLKPDLLAPGEKIVSASSTQAAGASPGGSSLFKEDSGTSMAAPHVSGAIAAFLSVRNEFIGRTDEVKAVLKTSAIDLQRDPTVQGAGLLNLFAALQAV